MAEVFRCLTDGIWADMGNREKKTASALVIRRNLQREYLKELTNLVLGERSSGSMMMFFRSDPTPPDAKSLARMYLREIDRKVEAELKKDGKELDDTSRAHLEEVHERITKVITASMQVNEP